MKLIEDIENELKFLGFSDKPMNKTPDLIIRIRITLEMAHLYYNEKHLLELNDIKWLQYYSHHVHFFDCEKYDKLADLFFELVNKLAKDIGFKPAAE